MPTRGSCVLSGMSDGGLADSHARDKKETDVEKMGQRQDWCMATVLRDEIRFSSLALSFMGRNESA